MPNKPVAVILAAKRTPIGNFNGCFANTKATTLGSVAIQGCLSSASCDPRLVDQAIIGCVLSAGLGQAPARQAALGATLAVNTPCVTINKMCGSGMQSLIFACDAIVAGSSNMIIAGGIENMSQAPYLLTKARSGYRFGHDQIFDHLVLDGLEDAYTPRRPMGHFAEQCAKDYNFSREQQDGFALASLQRATAAIANGYFTDEISSVVVQHNKREVVITEDEGPGSVSAEKIPKLKPVFQQDGTITAANASSISDGAAALLLADHGYAEKQELNVIATIIAHATHADEPALFPTAPIGAIRSVLTKANWNINDVDLFEINEAFAVVTMAAMQELAIPHDKVNVNGGACILGHPVGASGARIVVTLIHALQQRQLQKGIAALCIGGGEATAIAIEIKN